jgi:hypothetical protein
MKFVIELDDFACSMAEHQVMRWGWERELKRHSQRLAIKTQVGQAEVELGSNQIRATGLPRAPAHTVKWNGMCDSTTRWRNTTKVP